MPIKFIDVEKIFKEKNASAYKWTPSFILNYVKKIVWEKRINAFQNKNNHLHDIAYLDACLKEIGANFTYSGLENIPATGGIIMASNHPLGGLDGMALMQVVANVRKDINFLVNDILTNLKNFGYLFVPVNKVGANAVENIKRIEEVYASSNAVLVFPAGLVSRRTNGVVKDLDWNKSFISKAIKYNKPILPVYINGKLSDFFYSLSSFRKKIGVKANIEMLYLANEMFKLEGKKIHITIGKPIAPTSFIKEKRPAQWAAIFKEYVYTLGNNSNITFQEFCENY